MVRIVAQGLLIAGITATSLTNSSRASIEAIPSIADFKSSSNLACKQLELSCIDKNEPVLAINGDLWHRNIAKSILPNSPFFNCDRQNIGIKKQFWKTDLSRSSLKAIANYTCGFTWQQQLRQLVALESDKTSSIISKPNSAQSGRTTLSTTPKFPKLARSSLIVDFPLSNTTFTPHDTKLANPAPATKRIASPFGWRSRPYSNQLQFHQGIDYGAPYGSTVVSVGNGIVTEVVSGCSDFGNLFCGGQLGNWIEVDHGHGIVGTYGHLKYSSITVKKGMRVRKNQPIAQVGSSGWSTGAHLDFRLKVNGQHENPAKYVMAIEQAREGSN